MAQPDGNEDQGPLSPLVRKMAREYNIDLGQVRGTGAGGRIIIVDDNVRQAQRIATELAVEHRPLIEADPEKAGAQRQKTK